jgi:hypothetical protein
VTDRKAREFAHSPEGRVHRSLTSKNPTKAGRSAPSRALGHAVTAKRDLDSGQTRRDDVQAACCHAAQRDAGSTSSPVATPTAQAAEGAPIDSVLSREAHRGMPWRGAKPMEGRLSEVAGNGTLQWVASSVEQSLGAEAAWQARARATARSQSGGENGKRAKGRGDAIPAADGVGSSKGTSRAAGSRFGVSGRSGN